MAKQITGEKGEKKKQKKETRKRIKEGRQLDGFNIRRENKIN
jgi:hypothetical protein